MATIWKDETKDPSSLRLTVSRSADKLSVFRRADVNYEASVLEFHLLNPQLYEGAEIAVVQ